MPTGIYKRTNKQIEILRKNSSRFGFQKGHRSFLNEHDKKKIGKGLKLAYAEKRRTSYFAEHEAWNKDKHIKMNDALEIWRAKGGKNTGAKCWNWIKDRKILQLNKRPNPEYKLWVRKVKYRDHNKCQMRDENCSGYNIAHHIKSWARYPDLRYKVYNGITLCQAHHPNTRAEEKRLEPILEALISVSSVQFGSKNS
jgi:hypothetical protein